MSVAAAVAESSEMAGGGLVAAAGKCLAAPESDKASHPTLLETARSWRGILVFTHLAREGRMTVTIDGGELLAALGGAVAAWPLAARGQQTGNVLTIGRAEFAGRVSCRRASRGNRRS